MHSLRHDSGGAGRAGAGSRLGLWLILLLGIGLRLFRLGAWEIGLDEAYSANVATLGLGNLLHLIATEDFHPPLHYVFLHFWRMLGTNEVLLRLSSVGFAVLAIWVVFKLGATLAGHQVGLVAALIVALSPLHIYYAQELRMYALLFLLATSSMYLFARVLLDPDDLSAWVAYTAVTLMALYTHYGALVPIVGENLTVAVLLLLRQRVALGRWIGSQAMILAGFFPWLFTFATHYSRTSPESAVAAHGASLVESYAFIVAAFTSHYLPGGTPLLKAVIAGAALLAALAGGLAISKNRVSAVLLLSCSLGTLGVAAILVGSRSLDSIGTFVFIPRTLIAASACFYVLIAVALTRVRPRTVAVAAFACLLALNVHSYRQVYESDRSGPWREIAGYVATNVHHGDSIVFVSGFWARPFDFYFSRYAIDVPFVRYHGSNYLDQVRQVTAHSQRVWLILKQTDAVDPRGRVRNLVGSSGKLDALRQFPDGTRVELYAVEGPNRRRISGWPRR